MIDIHCHILPGLDDGAADLEQALEMARIAQADGTTVIIATPHAFDGFYNASREEILCATEKLNRELRLQGLNLRLLPGADTYVDFYIRNWQPDEPIPLAEAMTLNDAGRFMLLELPAYRVPDLAKLEMVIRTLRKQGVTPIISHPERNLDIQVHLSKLTRLIDAGALAQITASSLVGEFGRTTRRFAQKLLKSGLVHFLATDAHGIGSREPRLTPGFEAAVKLIGTENARKLVLDNPQAILDNRPLPDTK